MSDKDKIIKNFGSAKSFGDMKNKLKNDYEAKMGQKLSAETLNKKASEFWRIVQLNNIEAKLPKLTAEQQGQCKQYQKLNAQLNRLNAVKKPRAAKVAGPRKDELVNIAKKNEISVYNKEGGLKSKAAIKTILTKNNVKY